MQRRRFKHAPLDQRLENTDNHFTQCEFTPRPNRVVRVLTTERSLASP